MSYFAVIQVGYSVFGVGTTKEEALEEANKWADNINIVGEHQAFDGDFIIVECSEGLYKEVLANGGLVVYDERDGVYYLDNEGE